MAEPISILNLSWQRALILNNDAAKRFERKLMVARRSIQENTRASGEALKSLLHRLSCSLDESTWQEPAKPVIEVPRHTSKLGPITDLVPTTQPTELMISDIFGTVIERICSHRVRLYELNAKNPLISAEWATLADEMEEIEARALTVVILPSLSILEDISMNANSQLKVVLDRLESQAARCLAAAEALTASQPRITRVEEVKTKTCDQEFSEQTLKSAALSNLPLSSDVPTLSQSKQLIEATANLLYPLLSDYKLREQTLQVKRIVSCACSQITRQDRKHCLDRMQYLLSFLNGEPVKVTGRSSDGSQSLENKLVLTTLLPQDLGFIYAWHCLFSATLSQAEHQFAYHPESAVVFALLLSGILARYPEKTTEFLARIFLACPILCTFLDDDALDAGRSMLDASDVLGRWRGVSRLFAALSVGRPPSCVSSSSLARLNPAFLWRVIVGIANRPFLPCGSAEVLHGLLEVGTSALMQLYGQQFDKLLSCITSVIHSSTTLSQSSPEIALLSTIESLRRR